VTAQRTADKIAIAYSVMWMKIVGKLVK